GGKAPAAMVRGDADAAVAEAVVDIPEHSAAAAALDEAGAVRNDDGTIVISRSVGSTTRGRTVVGGRQVPQALLADCAAEFVTIHGQADQARLRSAAHQRSLLDQYAGPDHLDALARYGAEWAQLQ